MIQVRDLYFEKFITAQTIQKRVQTIGKVIADDFKDKYPLFIGILNGGFIFTADLVRACGIPADISFIKIASYEGLASTGSIAIDLDFQIDIQDRHLIFVEDIIDTGNTIAQLLPLVKAKAPASVTIASLLLKPTVLQHPLSIDYIGFEISNKFVIGYGMDYQGGGRYLPDIYQLKKDS